MTNFHDSLNEQLQDPEIRAEYDALEPDVLLIQAMIDDRKEDGLTQKQSTERNEIY